MADKLSLYNQALVLLGDSPITSLVGGPGSSIQERRLDRVITAVKRRFIEAYPWNFAIARAQLVRNATAPAFGWKYAYDRPLNWVRYLNLWDSPDADERCPDIRHVQEGKSVLTDAEEVYARYLFDVAIDDIADNAAGALAAWMAHELAISVTELQSKSESTLTTAQRRTREARTIDARLGDETGALNVYSWDAARNA